MFMFGKRHKDNGEKVFRYSIRKYHFGAASVAIAALIFFANGVAQAETLPVRPETANVQSSPEGERSDSGGRAVSEIQPAEQPKVLTQSVNKDALRIAIGNLSDVVRKVESSKLVALESQLTQVVEESKRLLEDGDATEQAVATEVETINSLIREVEKLLPKSEPTVDEPADKKDKEASIEHPKDEKKVVSDQEKSKKDLSIVDKAKLNEDKAAVNQGSEDRLTSNPNKVAKKELPTYSNENDGATNLSNELYFIYGELKKANTDTSKIQEVKDAYDKINNAIPLANNGVVNQAIFDAALVDLKKARDLIESVLNGKTTDNSTTTPVNPQPRSDDEELPSRGRGRTRTTRTVREGTENYDNSRESFFEDGKKGNSPYDKYTYVFYSRRQVSAIDNASRPVEEARNQIYADVTPTDTGFKWDIYINRSKYDLSDAVGWFTIPNGQNLKSGSVDISWKSNEGEHATSPNDGTISGALREAGFRNVTEGTPKRSGVSKEGNSTVNKKYNSSDLYTLSHTGGTTGQNPYKKNLENAAEKGLAEAKFDIINNSNGKLFYFELNRDLKTYHLSFETIGSNNINTLAYAVGMKGERQDDDNNRLRTRFLVNQWYARTKSEVDKTDKVKFKVAGRGYFKINQHTAYVNFISDSQYIGRRIYSEGNNVSYNYPQYIENPLNPDTKGVLTYSRTGAAKDSFDIDITSYGTYENENGQPFEKQEGKSKAEQNGQKFDLFTTVDGRVRNLTRKELTLDAISTPGVHTYRYNRSFTDASHDTGTFNFVTKPKKPTLTTDLARQAGKTINIQASNGTNGYEMRLYKRATDGSLTEVLGENGKPLIAKAGADGVATFTDVKVEEADYVVKTVVEGKWIDYDNTRHSTVESDESNKKTATDGVPPKISVNNTNLPEVNTPSNPIYTVVQGERFNPVVKVWDNSGNITKLSIGGTVPIGVNKNKFDNSFSSVTNATEDRKYTASTLDGTVSSEQRPGHHVMTFTVKDANNNEKNYYFNYVIKPAVPTVTSTTTENRILSTDKTLTGRGAAGATVKVTVNNKVLKEVRVQPNGTWSVTLDKGFNSNNASNVGQLPEKDIVKVTQSVDGVESSENNVTVAVGDTRVQPSETDGNSVYAGANNINVKVPHDAGIFYVKYYDKVTNQSREISVKRDSLTGPWTSTKTEYATVVATTKDAFTDTVTLRMAESIKESTPSKVGARDDDRIFAISNIKDKGYSSPAGWQPIAVTNEAPTIAPGNQGNTVTVEHGSSLNLMNLVTVRDKEDDKQATRGTRVHAEIISVNDVATTKEVSTNRPGVYRVKYKAVDSQGKESGETTVTVNVKPETPTVTSTTTENRILSTDKTLTGRGAAGATVKVTVNNKVLKEVRVQPNGTWSVTLDKGFNSNNASNVGQLPEKDIVKVTQSVDGVESSENNVTVAVGDTRVQPSETDGNSVYAGANNINVKVPHDAGIFYVKYYDKVTNQSREISVKRDSLTGPWTSTKTEYATVVATTKDAFTDTVTLRMAESIKESTPSKVGARDDDRIFAISNIKDKGYSSPAGWQPIAVTNEAPTIAPGNQGNTVTVEHGSSLNLMNLVTVRDKEDDKQATRGTRVHAEILSVNDVATTKEVRTNQPGVYRVKYKAVDSQGKQSGETTVTVNVKPPKPTFNAEAITSTSRIIRGTLGGLNNSAGKAVVGVALNDGSGRVLTSEKNGGVTISGNTWTATLPDDVKLRTSVAKNGETTQPNGLTVTTKIKGVTPADDISVVSDNKAVEMGDYSVLPTIAGSKHIDIRVPHDAKRVELRFHNSEENGDKANSIVLVRSQNGGDWHVDAVRTDHTVVSDANKFVAKIENGVSRTNASENLVRIHLKEIEGGSKLHLKEEVANGSGTSTYGKGLGLRVAYQSEAGQDPVTAGNWMIANISNTSPTLEYKGTEGRSDTTRKVFPSGTSITKEKLAELVTIRDTEDNHTVLEDKPYGNGSLQIMSGLKETLGKATPAGRYTVVLKAIDSQGKESNTLPVHVGVVSTDLKYQPKVKGINVGNSKEITITGSTHQNGESITYTPIEKFTESGKQYVLKTKGIRTAYLTDEDQVFNIEYVEDFTPEVPAQKLPVATPGTLSPKEKEDLKAKVKEANPGKDVTVDETGKAIVTDTTTNVSHEIPADKLVVQDFTPEVPAQKLPVATPGTLSPKEKEDLKAKVKEANPGKDVTVDETGKAIVTDTTTNVSHEIPADKLVVQDFTPEVPAQKLPVATPGTLSPVRPTGDGQQRPATPSDDTNPRPNTVTPAEVPAAQPAGQPSQTVEVPAQLPNEMSETDSSVSKPQAVLPNTGTQEDRANGALGLLSLLGAFGLLFSKKKKDDEEEA